VLVMALTLEFRRIFFVRAITTSLSLRKLGFAQYACFRPCVQIRPTEPACCARRPRSAPRGRHFSSSSRQGYSFLVIYVAPICHAFAKTAPFGGPYSRRATCGGLRLRGGYASDGQSLTVRCNAAIAADARRHQLRTLASTFSSDHFPLPTKYAATAVIKTSSRPLKQSY
jgi:hypothetical protein